MSEREEKLISKIIKMQNAHNSLNLEEEIEKYKKDIKDAEANLEKTKNEIKILSSKLNELESNIENNSSSSNERNIENKNNLLNNIQKGNSMKSSEAKSLKDQVDNYQKEDYIRQIIQSWDPQTMFKYIQLFDKKSE